MYSLCIPYVIVLSFLIWARDPFFFHNWSAVSPLKTQDLHPPSWMSPRSFWHNWSAVSPLKSPDLHLSIHFRFRFHLLPVPPSPFRNDLWPRLSLVPSLDRDHMIKRNGTSLSLVQKTRGVGLFHSMTHIPAPYYYEQNHLPIIRERPSWPCGTIKTWTHARVLLDAQLRLFHLPFTRGSPRPLPWPRPQSPYGLRFIPSLATTLATPTTSKRGKPPLVSPLYYWRQGLECSPSLPQRRKVFGKV